MPDRARPGNPTRAAALNPTETQITLPNQIKWTAWTAGPPRSTEMATLFGVFDQPGEYAVLTKCTRPI
jgi:hypothetical protein